MRWTWLSMLLVAGCGGAGTADSADKSEGGWVIHGAEPAKLLLTNGSFGVWVSTDDGVSGEDGFRINREALIPIPGFVLSCQSPLEDGERIDWSFDLRTGELVAIRTEGRLDTETRFVLHPSLPVAAMKWRGLDPTEPFGVIEVFEANLPMVEGRAATTDDRRTYLAEPAIPGEIGDHLGLTLIKDISANAFGAFLNEEKIELPKSYEEVLAASKQAHEEFWKTDIEIDGPAKDQLAIRTMLYYLRRGATPKLPPFGATNAKYRGARFWDAEAWMLPVLAIVDRQKAKEATQWRLENLGDYVPWEAAVGGKDVTPKGFGNALHVAGWVAWWMGRARELQLLTPSEEKKALDVVFPQFYKTASDSGRGMEIKGVESPDEGKLRDNDLVTNLLAKRVARAAAAHGIADGEDLEWFKSIVIARATDGLPATYDNDLIRGYQQTAALLAIYPLEEDFGPGVAERMFERYADLTSEVGPAMSESIHATIAARLGRKDAYSRWRKSWQTYTDDAMMFHERRNKQDAYFMTGAAGCLQTVLFGFAGIRHADEGKESATGKLLPDGYPVSFRPSLPAEWKSITLRNIFLGPRRATVRIDRSGASIE